VNEICTCYGGHFALLLYNLPSHFSLFFHFFAKTVYIFRYRKRQIVKKFTLDKKNGCISRRNKPEKRRNTLQFLREKRRNRKRPPEGRTFPVVIFFSKKSCGLAGPEISFSGQTFYRPKKPAT